MSENNTSVPSEHDVGAPAKADRRRHADCLSLGAAGVPGRRSGPDLPGRPGRLQALARASDPALDPHRTLGFAMAGAAIIILILTLIARPGARAIVGAVLLVLMTVVLQSLLAELADDHVIFGALHATDGLLILAIPAYLYVWTGRSAA